MFTLCSSLFCQNCDTTGSCHLDTVGSSETLNMSWQKEEGPYLWSFTEASKHLCSLLIVIIATCLGFYLIFHLCGVPTVFFHPEVRVTAAFHQIKPFPKARNEAYTTRRSTPPSSERYSATLCGQTLSVTCWKATLFLWSSKCSHGSCHEVALLFQRRTVPIML